MSEIEQNARTNTELYVLPGNGTTARWSPFRRAGNDAAQWRRLRARALAINPDIFRIVTALEHQGAELRSTPGGVRLLPGELGEEIYQEVRARDLVPRAVTLCALLEGLPTDA